METVFAAGFPCDRTRLKHVPLARFRRRGWILLRLRCDLARFLQQRTQILAEGHVSQFQDRFARASICLILIGSGSKCFGDAISDGLDLAAALLSL
jgi:hypothetical protein